MERYEKYMRIIAGIMGLGYDKVMGMSRKGNYPLARQIVWESLQQEGVSAMRIGELSGRNHSTILSGIKYMQGVAEYSQEIRDYREQFKKSIYGQQTDKQEPGES